MKVIIALVELIKLIKEALIFFMKERKKIKKKRFNSKIKESHNKLGRGTKGEQLDALRSIEKNITDFSD